MVQALFPIYPSYSSIWNMTERTTYSFPLKAYAWLCLDLPLTWTKRKAILKIKHIMSISPVCDICRSVLFTAWCVDWVPSDKERQCGNYLSGDPTVTQETQVWVLRSSHDKPADGLITLTNRSHPLAIHSIANLQSLKWKFKGVYFPIQ